MNFFKDFYVNVTDGYLLKFPRLSGSISPGILIFTFLDSPLLIILKLFPRSFLKSADRCTFGFLFEAFFDTLCILLPPQILFKPNQRSIDISFL